MAAGGSFLLAAGNEHPTVDATNVSLRKGPPTNVADRADLVDDELALLGEKIRTSSTNDWLQLWNESVGNQIPVPKHEDHCRDALLSDLQSLLPVEANAEPEGRYAFDNRSDIKVIFDQYHVPVEIKNHSHRDIWSAMRDQLIAKYTFDPSTGGFSIYLVLWSGADIPYGSIPPEFRPSLQET